MTLHRYIHSYICILVKLLVTFRSTIQKSRSRRNWIKDQARSTVRSMIFFLWWVIFVLLYISYEQSDLYMLDTTKTLLVATIRSHVHINANRDYSPIAYPLLIVENWSIKFLAIQFEILYPWIQVILWYTGFIYLNQPRMKA